MGPTALPWVFCEIRVDPWLEVRFSIMKCRYYCSVLIGISFAFYFWEWCIRGRKWHYGSHKLRYRRISCDSTNSNRTGYGKMFTISLQPGPSCQFKCPSKPNRSLSITNEIKATNTITHRKTGTVAHLKTGLRVQPITRHKCTSIL